MGEVTEPLGGTALLEEVATPHFLFLLLCFLCVDGNSISQLPVPASCPAFPVTTDSILLELKARTDPLFLSCFCWHILLQQ